MEDRGLLKNIM